MNNKKIFVVLGADMVGKTTMINTSMRRLDNDGVKCTYTHFSAPPPGTDPCDMYRDALKAFGLGNTQYWYLDRAWPESRFYEMHRRNKDLPFEDMMAVEKDYVQFAEAVGYDISINVLWKPWEFIEKFHIHELENNQEFVQESALKNNESVDLQSRKEEYVAYYKFMQEYFARREREYPQLAKNFPMNSLGLFDLNFTLV